MLALVCSASPSFVLERKYECFVLPVKTATANEEVATAAVAVCERVREEYATEIV